MLSVPPLSPASLFPLLDRLPPSLAADGAMLHRVANLVDPADSEGTRGTYAGWIARSAVLSCIERADAANLASLLHFFQKGGSIRGLEAVASKILPGFPIGWRYHRRKKLFASNDPLRFLKIRELEDRRLLLTAGEVSSVSERGQGSAYLDDDDIVTLADRIAREAPEETDAWKARWRYRKTRNAIAAVLADPEKPYPRLWPAQIRIAFENLSDGLSREAARRIQTEYSLHPARPGEFENLVRDRYRQEGVIQFKDPVRRRAVYFKASANLGAAVYLQSHPPDLSPGLPAPDALFEVLAVAKHEDDHHVRVRARGYSGRPEETFAFEFSAHGYEFLWRAYQGDAAPLRKMTVENPLGFGLAFRDYFEKIFPS